jgi:hypothetical protein
MSGVMGLFETREALLDAIAATRARGLGGVTAFAPAYDAGVLDASGAMRSPVAGWTLAGGIAGAVAALLFTVWTVRQWPVLLVSGKPLIAWPPFLIIAFEMTILFAAMSAMTAFLVCAHRARVRSQAAYDPSLSDARFGLLVPCPAAGASEIGALMTKLGATTWHVV